MLASITIQQFLRTIPRMPVIDVRTSAEFEVAHIPEAVNVPLFSNEERAMVGTAYVQNSREEAILLGLDLVGPKLRSLVKSARDSIQSDQVLVHCWRGGMRSAAMAWLLSIASELDVYVLEGGYKAFRRHMLAALQKPLQLLVVGGKTGSRKTDILHALKSEGEQVLDLEALAHHRGSAFGGIGQPIPPTQEQFENLLGWHWLTFAPDRPVWVEDESRRIGKRALPGVLWKRLLEAPIFYLETPLEQRIDYLIHLYGDATPENLETGIKKIQKRLGGHATKLAVEAVYQGNLREACSLVLKYYDKAYTHCLNQRQPGTIYPIHTTTLDPHVNVELVRKAASEARIPAIP